MERIADPASLGSRLRLTMARQDGAACCGLRIEPRNTRNTRKLFRKNETEFKESVAASRECALTLPCTRHQRPGRKQLERTDVALLRVHNTEVFVGAHSRGAATVGALLKSLGGGGSGGSTTCLHWQSERLTPNNEPHDILVRTILPHPSPLPLGEGELSADVLRSYDDSGTLVATR